MISSLTIIIPAFNEAANFKAGKLEEVADYLKKNKLDWEVLVVDDGSSDGSNVAIAKWVNQQLHWRFIQNPHQGKAATVMAGVVAATKPHLLFTDFDQATPIGEVEKLLPFIAKGYQIVIGSREVKGSLRAKEPWYRHLMGKGFNFLVQIVALRGIHDTQCGFKIFDAKIAKDLFNRLKVYRPRPEKHAFTGAFDVELLFLAQKQGLEVAEVPVHWYHSPTTRVNPIRDSIRMFMDVVKIRLADLFGLYR
ncbi:MAG TPA: dolichyl-phosphate beta-glucosyltransferase [Patescibacteria group bacterium]|nr:dolichyl-phosphate beta-glucosyltransferase [Patescibacteria group bacterium]